MAISRGQINSPLGVFVHQLAAYLKEREDFECIVRDEGFASYKIFGDEAYIRDVWVHPNHRSSGVASEIGDEIAKLAKKAGCKFLSGSVSTAANNATVSVKFLLAYGFQVHSAIQNGIIFRKEI